MEKYNYIYRPFAYGDVGVYCCSDSPWCPIPLNPAERLQSQMLDNAQLKAYLTVALDFFEGFWNYYRVQPGVGTSSVVWDEWCFASFERLASQIMLDWTPPSTLEDRYDGWLAIDCLRNEMHKIITTKPRSESASSKKQKNQSVKLQTQTEQAFEASESSSTRQTERSTARLIAGLRARGRTDREIAERTTGQTQCQDDVSSSKSSVGTKKQRKRLAKRAAARMAREIDERIVAEGQLVSQSGEMLSQGTAGPLEGSDDMFYQTPDQHQAFSQCGNYEQQQFSFMSQQCNGDKQFDNAVDKVQAYKHAVQLQMGGINNGDEPPPISFKKWKHQQRAVARSAAYKARKRVEEIMAKRQLASSQDTAGPSHQQEYTPPSHWQNEIDTQYQSFLHQNYSYGTYQQPLSSPCGGDQSTEQLLQLQRQASADQHNDGQQFQMAQVCEGDVQHHQQKSVNRSKPQISWKKSKRYQRSAVRFAVYQACNKFKAPPPTKFSKNNNG